MKKYMKVKQKLVSELLILAFSVPYPDFLQLMTFSCLHGNKSTVAGR